MKAVGPHPPRFRSKALESGDDVRVDGGVVRHAGIAEFCAERLCDVPVAPKIRMNSALMPRHIDTAMRDKKGRAQPPLVEQRPQIGKDSGAGPFDIDAQANRARVEAFGELRPHRSISLESMTKTPHQAQKSRPSSEAKRRFNSA